MMSLDAASGTTARLRLWPDAPGCTLSAPKLAPFAASPCPAAGAAAGFPIRAAVEEEEPVGPAAHPASSSTQAAHAAIAAAIAVAAAGARPASWSFMLVRRLSAHQRFLSCGYDYVTASGTTVSQAG